MINICKTHHCSVGLNYYDVDLTFQAPLRLWGLVRAHWNCADFSALWVSVWAVCLLRKGSGACLLLVHLGSAPAGVSLLSPFHG